MNIKDLIPKHKHDHDVIEGLQRLSFEELEPIVPELLEWLQDMNWPIAHPVACILKPHADKIMPEIVKIFRTNDGMWKYWMIIVFAQNTTNPIILKEVERIAKFPTPDEIMDEVNILANEILNGEY